MSYCSKKYVFTRKKLHPEKQDNILVSIPNQYILDVVHALCILNRYERKDMRQQCNLRLFSKNDGNPIINFLRDSYHLATSDLLAYNLNYSNQKRYVCTMCTFLPHYLRIFRRSNKYSEQNKYNFYLRTTWDVWPKSPCC